MVDSSALLGATQATGYQRLWKDLVIAALPRNGVFYDMVRRVTLPVTSTAYTVVSSRVGQGLLGGAVDSYSLDTSQRVVPRSPTGCTLMAYVRRVASPAQENVLFFVGTSPNIFYMSVDNPPRQNKLLVYAGGANDIYSPNILPIDTPVLCAAEVQYNVSLKLLLDGLVLTSVGPEEAVSSAGSGDVYVAGFGSGFGTTSTEMYVGYVWNRSLSLAEHRLMAMNPFAPLRMPRPATHLKRTGLWMPRKTVVGR